LVVAGFLAAIFSTADELLNCCGYAVLADFLNLPRTAGQSDAQYIRSGKFYTGIFAFFSAAFAYFILASGREITDFFNVVIATQVVFLLPLLFGLYGSFAGDLRRITLFAMLAAFVTALGITAVGWSTGGPDGKELIDSAPLLAFIVELVIMAVGWLWRKIKPPRTVLQGESEQ
jgi:Na+/proline symporter